MIIAHLDRAAAHHAAATNLLASSASDTFVTSAITMAVVLVGPTSAGRQADTLALVAELGIDVVDLRAQDAGPLADLRSSCRLRLPDCCVLNLALTGGGAIATFDSRLASAAGSLGVPRVR